MAATQPHRKRKLVRETGGTEDGCPSCHLWDLSMKCSRSCWCHLGLMAAWKHRDSPNNGCRFNSIKKDQGDNLKNKLVPGGGVLGEKSQVQRVSMVTTKIPAGVEGCHQVSNWDLKCTLGLDSKLPKDAACCSKQMKIPDPQDCDTVLTNMNIF